MFIDLYVHDYLHSFLNIGLALEVLMADVKVYQSSCGATLEAREVGDDFVYGSTSKCSFADLNDLVGLQSFNSDMR